MAAPAPVGALSVDLALLFGRLELAAIFLVSGIGKLGDLDGFSGMLAAKGVPAATIVAPLAVAVETAGAIAVALVLFTRPAALALILFTTAATATSHLYWLFPAEEQDAQSIQFWKNVAIMGDFLILAASGPGRLANDALRRRNAK